MYIKESTPLVSVVIPTYNSSDYVIETLNSIKAQTYENIELIVSDDCSQDDTVQRCRKWIKENEKRFIHCELLTADYNTGTSATCNRGVVSSTGEWIKLLAGDDLLMPKCIEENILFIQNNPDTEIVFSCLQAFGNGDTDTINHMNSIIWTKPNILNKRELHILECYYNVFGTPTSFFSKSLFLRLDGFNEHIPLIEDWPFWVKATKFYKVMVMDRLTVWYRIHNKSISWSNNNNRYIDNLRLCKWNNIQYMRRVSPLFGILGYLDYQIEYHNNLMWRLLGLSRYINPYYYVRKRIYNFIFPLNR